MKLFIINLTFLAIASSCGSFNKNKDALNIAVAANMKAPMDSIVKVFKQNTGITCKIYSNSSGTINTQVEQGAPYDIFISANTIYPENLFRKKIAESPVLYASGRLTLVSHKSFKSNKIENILKSNDIKKIAIAFPEQAPYGKAAIEVLTNLNLNKSLKKKIVYGESISQVNQLFVTNSVDAAFTSYSFLNTYSEECYNLNINSNLHSEIKQSAVCLIKKNKMKLKKQKEFITFLVSQKCQDILKYYGYQNIK